MGKFIDMTGQRYGKLVAIKRVPIPEHIKSHSAWWLFKCDCGKEVEINSLHVRNGHIKSCGCWQRERLTKHGMTNTILFSKWNRMLERCRNHNRRDYKDYGGRGICVCDEWKKDFMAFYNWAVESGYKEGLTLDRINNDGNYEPSNCRWATPKEQANNRRSSVFLTYNGETHTVSQWAEIQHIPRDTLDRRMRQCGWSVEKALTTPVKRQKNNRKEYLELWQT
jgi:hypothetical protein